MFYTNHTGMRTMWASKGIINKDISKSTQLFSEFSHILMVNFYSNTFIILVISFLLRIEPNVLTKKDFTLRVVNFINNMLSNAVIQKSHRSS